MYILSISPKAFIKQDEDIIIVCNPDRATAYKAIGDAMKVASEINKDFGVNIVKILPL